MENNQNTSTNETCIIKVVGTDLIILDHDGCQSGMISRPTDISLPYGTRIKFRDINHDFVLGTEEKKKECEEYYNFNEKKTIKNIIIELPKGSDILWMSNANPMNMHHQILSEDKKFIFASGKFILPQNTPIMTKKIFMVLSKATFATY